MNRWLIKSEPSTWSWEDQIAAGATNWDGVRNAQATIHLKTMRHGDLCYFYHSGKPKSVVGMVRVVKPAVPDPSDASGRGVMVRVETVGPLPAPVTLAQIKADKNLAQLALVRNSRLSVMPVDEGSWRIIQKIAENNAET